MERLPLFSRHHGVPRFLEGGQNPSLKPHIGPQQSDDFQACEHEQVYLANLSCKEGPSGKLANPDFPGTGIRFFLSPSTQSCDRVECTSVKLHVSKIGSALNVSLL